MLKASAWSGRSRTDAQTDDGVIGPVELGIGNGDVAESAGMVRLDAEGVLIIVDGLGRLAQRQTGDAEAAEGIDVVGFRLQDLLIELHGPLQVAVAVMFQGKFQGFGWGRHEITSREVARAMAGW